MSPPPELIESILAKWGNCTPGPEHAKHHAAIVGAGVSGLVAARGTFDIHPETGQVAFELAGLTKEFRALARPEGSCARSYLIRWRQAPSSGGRMSNLPRLQKAAPRSTCSSSPAAPSSVNATLARDANLLLPLAERSNLSFTAFGEALTPSAAAYGTLDLSAPQPLEPAPITPSGSGAKPYELLAGTIREVFRVARTGVEDIVVAPGLMTGNTDTRFNWELSKHIFRYGHGNMIAGGLGGIYTVNEHIKADAFVEMITFFTTLILNADEADL
ncbi:Carboxypeptidase S [Mycena sanguinolenta]|uniref:Carboxypeptidase S n=1 Tax=Mycena sanguinolenta TaxID=230812 RepID=A0A8H6XCJ6_9AGAR|nr:Carboxypeptidase S [Mycena sanguinolenta]